MSADDDTTADTRQDEQPIPLPAAAGIVVTPAGKRAARRRLDEAAAAWTGDLDDALRAQLGLPGRAAA